MDTDLTPNGKGFLMTDADGMVFYDDFGNVLPDRFIRPVVYFIEAVGLDLVKIGYTEELIRRFKEIRTSCPVPIRLIGFCCGCTQLEASLHRDYRNLRVQGEWFRICQESMNDWRVYYGGPKSRGMYEDFRNTCEGNKEHIPWRPMPLEIETFEEVYLDLMEEVAEGFANV